MAAYKIFTVGVLGFAAWQGVGNQISKSAAYPMQSYGPTHAEAPIARASRRRALLPPKQRGVVVTEYLVPAHEHQSLDLRLSDEQAIEGVLVEVAKIKECENVLLRDEKYAQTVLLPLLAY